MSFCRKDSAELQQTLANATFQSQGKKFLGKHFIDHSPQWWSVEVLGFQSLPPAILY
jgi:hypothetical protein